MYGVSTGASCRSLCELTRNMLRVLDGLVSFGVITIAGRIVDPKHLERRLVHKDVASLGNHAGYRTDCITHGGMLGYDQLRAEAARNFRIKRASRSANGNQRNRETDLRLNEPGERTTCREVIDQDTQRSPTPVRCFDTRILCERAFEYNTRRLPKDMLVSALAQALRRIPLSASSPIALLGGENRSAKPCGLNAPAFLPSQDMHRIAGSEPRKSCKSTIHQSPQCFDALGGPRYLVETSRDRHELLPDPLLEPI